MELNGTTKSLMPDHQYIYTGWLIDGSGGPVQKKVWLTIVNGVFAGIESFDDTTAPDPALVTDLSRCTILPPLVDSHVHLSMSSTIDPSARQKQLEASYTDTHSLISHNIHYFFTHGVLAVRDAGDRQGHVLRYKEKNPANNRDPVILKTAGRAWHKQGRYGGMLGRHPKENEPLADAVARETDQADFIKIINSGQNSLTEFGKETPPQFDLDEMTQFVRLAAKLGKKAMVHANGELPVRIALEAGCHSIEHGFFMGRENLERMADKQTVWVPTAYAMKTCSEKIGKEDIFFAKGVAEKNLHHQLKQIALARELGVPIAMGTDAGCRGVLHGESVVEELKLLMKAGFSLPEAVQCASNNGAKLLEIEEQMGLIALGKPAHFLVARGTPAQLPRKLSYLEAIYLGGSPCRKNFFHKI